MATIDEMQKALNEATKKILPDHEWIKLNREGDEYLGLSHIRNGQFLDPDVHNALTNAMYDSGIMGPNKASFAKQTVQPATKGNNLPSGSPIFEPIQKSNTGTFRLMKHSDLSQHFPGLARTDWIKSFGESLAKNLPAAGRSLWEPATDRHGNARLYANLDNMDTPTKSVFINFLKQSGVSHEIGKTMIPKFAGAEVISIDPKDLQRINGFMSQMKNALQSANWRFYSGGASDLHKLVDVGLLKPDELKVLEKGLHIQGIPFEYKDIAGKKSLVVTGTEHVAKIARFQDGNFKGPYGTYNTPKPGGYEQEIVNHTANKIQGSIQREIGNLPEHVKASVLETLGKIIGRGAMKVIPLAGFGIAVHEYLGLEEASANMVSEGLLTQGEADRYKTDVLKSSVELETVDPTVVIAEGAAHLRFSRFLESLPPEKRDAASERLRPPSVLRDMKELWPSVKDAAAGWIETAFGPGETQTIKPFSDKDKAAVDDWLKTIKPDSLLDQKVKPEFEAVASDTPKSTLGAGLDIKPKL